MAIYSVSPYLIPNISRNLIQDNAADDLGGGIFFGAFYYTTPYDSLRIPTKARVDSNLIELNQPDDVP